MELELQRTPGDAATTLCFPVVHYFVCPPPRSSPATGTSPDPPLEPPLGFVLRRPLSRMRMTLVRSILA